MLEYFEIGRLCREQVEGQGWVFASGNVKFDTLLTLRYWFICFQCLKVLMQSQVKVRLFMSFFFFFFETRSL
jgi:hypothetical protein